MMVTHPSVPERAHTLSLATRRLFGGMAGHTDTMAVTPYEVND
jgi:hypothetical protein